MIRYFGCSTACMKLEEYQTAKAALETGASLSADKSRFVNLIKECDKLIAGKLYSFCGKTRSVLWNLYYLFIYWFSFSVLDFVWVIDGCVLTVERENVDMSF